jgi:hypothetical protein
MCRSACRAHRADAAVAPGFAGREVPGAQPEGRHPPFLAQRGDVEAAAGVLRESGTRILGDGKPQRNVAGERIAFIHPADFLGALVELEERKG